MFNKGENIIYGQMGVCEVTDVCEREIPHSFQKKMYYALKPLYHNNSMIYTPVDNVKVTMRPVISKDEANKLIALIPSIHVTTEPSHDVRQLTERYETAIHSDKCSDLIKLTMSIYEKKRAAKEQNRKIGSVDERFMKKAEELLFGELAVALEIPVEEVQSYISGHIS